MPNINRGQNNHGEKTTTVSSVIANILLISGIPASAYLLGFFYELGFCDWFKIPREFIVVQPNTLIVELYPLFLILVFLAVVGIAIRRHLKPRTKDPVYLGLLSLLPQFLITVAFILIWQDRWQIWSTVVFLFLSTAALILLFPRLRRDKGKSWRDKLEAQAVQNAQEIDAILDFLGWRKKQEDGIPGRTWRWFAVFALIVIASIGMLCYQYGGAKAATKGEYVVSSVHQNLVALRIYGDNMICAEVDRKAKTVKSDLFILNLSNVSEQAWELEQVGPLKPKPRQ